MSVEDVKPDVKVEAADGVKVDPAMAQHANGGPGEMAGVDTGIIKTAPDDIKPPPLDDLFRSDSPPPEKVEPSDPVPRSSSSSPGPSRPALYGRQSGRKKAAAVEHKPMLIDDLPTAWEEAHQSFVALDKCVYETKGLGLSREQDEMMVCDCVYDKRESGYASRVSTRGPYGSREGREKSSDGQAHERTTCGGRARAPRKEGISGLGRRRRSTCLGVRDCGLGGRRY